MLPRPELAAIRFGTGLPAGRGVDADPDAILADVIGPDTAARDYPGISMADAAAYQAEGAAAADRIKKDKNDAAEAALEAVKDRGRTAIMATTRVTLARAIDAPLGFRERLVRFWADHFTTRAKSRFVLLYPAAMVEDAVRPHVGGRFVDMLKAATVHPAMLDYLDQGQSVGPNSKMGKRRKRGLNENLARELIELHTLGVGADYSQTDVTQMAELLTGLAISKDAEFTFRPEQAEPGDETVLGVTYSGKGMDPIMAVLDDLAARPETAAHIARKLAVHFVADTPDPAMVSAMTEAYMSTDGDLASVYRAMLVHPSAWGETLAKARQPFDFIAAALRALGIDGQGVLAMEDKAFRRSIFGPLAAMGQPWLSPIGPDGWPEAPEAWITPQLLAGRVTWAMAEPKRLMKKLPEPMDVVTRALGPDPDGRVVWAAQRAETRDEGVGVIFASPSFNRR